MMSEKNKLSAKFFEVLQHEGVVAIMSWGNRASYGEYLEFIFGGNRR
jgi:hypothetical protein